MQYRNAMASYVVNVWHNAIFFRNKMFSHFQFQNSQQKWHYNYTKWSCIIHVIFQKIPAMKSELKKNQRTTFCSYEILTKAILIYNSLKLLLFFFVGVDCFMRQLYCEAITFCRLLLMCLWGNYAERMNPCCHGNDRYSQHVHCHDVRRPSRSRTRQEETAAAFRLSLWQLDARHLNVTGFNRSYKIQCTHTAPSGQRLIKIVLSNAGLCSGDTYTLSN